MTLSSQLSKQDRTRDRSDSTSESGFDSDNDPFKFTTSSSNCTNGHSPTFKHSSSSSYPPEFDKFAYHSPEHSSFETDSKLSGESKFSLSHDSSSGFSDRSSRDMSDKSRDMSDKSRDMSDKSRDMSDKSRDINSKARDPPKEDSNSAKPECPKKEKPEPAETKREVNENPKPTLVFSPAIGPVRDTSDILQEPRHAKSPKKTPKSPKKSAPSSVPSPVVTAPTVASTVAAKVPDPVLSVPKPPDDQPSSKLYRGKLSFFKQAISQEISTLQETEKKALAQLTAESVEKKPTLELTEPVATVLMPYKQSPPVVEKKQTPASPISSSQSSSVRSPVPSAARSPVSAGLRSPVPAPSRSPNLANTPISSYPVHVPSSIVRPVGPDSSVSAPRSPAPKHPGTTTTVRSTLSVNPGVHPPSPSTNNLIRSPGATNIVRSPVPGAVLRSPKKSDKEVDKVLSKDIKSSPAKRIPLSKDLPTNVVRNVVKRPLPVQPPQKLGNSQKGSFSPVPVKKPAQKVVHNSSPIPFVMNGHKVNVVKIEKHHMSPHNQISHKDLSVFKFTNDQPTPPQHPGYPVLPFSEYIKVQQSRKRKISGDHPKVEGGNKTKKVVKGTVLSPPHQITFSPSPLSSPVSANGVTPTSEIVKVDSSVVHKKSLQNSKPVHPVKSRKVSGQGSIATAKKTLQNKLLSQTQTKTKVSRAQSCPAIKEESNSSATPVKKEKTPVPETSPQVKVEPAEEERSENLPSDTQPAGDNLIKTVGTPTPPMPTLTDPKSCISVEPCPDGGATVVRLNMDTFNSLNFHQQHLIVDYFFEITFGETDGVADHVMGIISNGARGMPNVLKYMVENQPSLKVKHEVLGKKDVLNCTIEEYYGKVQSNHSRCIYHEGGLQHISLVGTKSEESGALFPELIHLMEQNPFFEVTLPWGALSKYDGLDPAISNDGPIFWVRPGEQFLQSTSGSRNHKGYRLLKNRETLVPDRTTPHADHSWEDGKTIATTAAAAFLQTVQLPGMPSDAEHSLKDVIAFDASNFYQLAEELQLDLYEPPMTQCDIWIEDAKLNQLRESKIKYAKLRLRANDMYFIPRNVIHQFKTVAACLSVAWHVRLKKYYDT